MNKTAPLQHSTGDDSRQSIPEGPISCHEFARLRGVSFKAVQEAIAMGRLRECIGRDRKGHALIVDGALAMREWEANTRPKINGTRSEPGALADATMRERLARARAMELELDRKTRALVPAREVDARWSALVVSARTAMLGIPTRAKGRLPHLTPADLVVLEALIREVLLELAADIQAG